MRHRRLVAAAMLALPATAMALAFTMTSARADAPFLQGWWSATNPNTPVGPLPVPAPGVPADGLLVQGGPNTPIAFAALTYDLDPTVTASKLTLTVAPASATTPAAQVEVCPLDSPTFSPAQGGSMADAPTYDCSAKVTAGPNADGTAYEFSVSSLVSGGSLAVALVPAAPTTRVVFSKPGDSSLSTQPVATTPFEPTTDTPPPVAPAPVTQDTGTAAPPVASAPLVPTDTAPSEAAPAPVVATPTPAATAASAFPAAVTDANKGPDAVVVAAVVGALALAGLTWAYAGRNPSTDMVEETT
jgi:hypothetical protein